MGKVKKTKHGVKRYDDKLPIIAICYDFDRTLSPKDMQEYTIIPKLKMSSKEFWEESTAFAKENFMDRMLAYMFKIVDLASKKEVKITESDFKKMGQAVELFSGVTTWFERINRFGQELGIHIEHYIVSAGLRELIEGTPIAKYVEQIYASSFFYDKIYRSVKWVKQVVNASSKTQYLFRINKGFPDVRDENSVHTYMEEEDRRIPFRNMIYIGDSDTDIPSMKVVTNQNGYAVGVYNPDEKGLVTVCRLLRQKRISHFAPADYSENSGMERLIMTILSSIKGKEEINAINSKQKTLAFYISDFSRYFNWLKSSIDSGNIENKEAKKIILYSYKNMKDGLEKEELSQCDLENALAFLDGLKNDAENHLKEKKKAMKKPKNIDSKITEKGSIDNGAT